MERINTKQLVINALFAALTCAATMVIRIPTPGTGGYIHPGDGIVILCGIFMGPAQAFLAAGIGSAMADLLGGYFIYVPITFVIKGLSASLGSRLFHRAAGRGRNPHKAAAGCGILNMALVAGGYWLCECLLYGPAAALPGLLPNLIQGAGGLVAACALYPLVRRPLEAAMSA